MNVFVDPDVPAPLLRRGIYDGDVSYSRPDFS